MNRFCLFLSPFRQLSIQKKTLRGAINPPRELGRCLTGYVAGLVFLFGLTTGLGYGFEIKRVGQTVMQVVHPKSFLNQERARQACPGICKDKGMVFTKLDYRSNTPNRSYCSCLRALKMLYIVPAGFPRKCKKACERKGLKWSRGETRVVSNGERRCGCLDQVEGFSTHQVINVVPGSGIEWNYHTRKPISWNDRAKHACPNVCDQLNRTWNGHWNSHPSAGIMCNCVLKDQSGEALAP